MAILEYYAFEADGGATEFARKNFRLLVRSQFRDFVYSQVGYNPAGRLPEAWQQFQDRVSLTYDSAPPGYFSVFKEIANIIVSLINAGAEVDSSFIPDISVGIHWSKHWSEKKLESVHGGRVKYDHDYPAYFPQAKANPHLSWCYPDSALGDFRRFLRQTYLQKHFPNYISNKINQGALPASFSELSIEDMSKSGKIRKIDQSERNFIYIQEINVRLPA